MLFICLSVLACVIDAKEVVRPANTFPIKPSFCKLWHLRIEMTLIKKLHCAFRKRQHRLCCGACRQGKVEGATNHTCPRNLRLQDLDHVHCNPALRFVSPILCRSFHDSFNLRLSFRRVNDKGEAHQLKTTDTSPNPPRAAPINKAAMRARKPGPSSALS